MQNLTSQQLQSRINLIQDERIKIEKQKAALVERELVLLRQARELSSQMQPSA